MPESRREEMDRLDRALAARRVRIVLGCTIRSAERERAGVIARRHGYALALAGVEEPGCVWAEFHPM